jgi:hypothetical protein
LKKRLFLSPHNDDETLFGAHIIQTYDPLVVILTDSFIQYERGEQRCSWQARQHESEAAMRILGAPVEFCHIPDKDFNEDLCTKALSKYAPKGTESWSEAPAYDMVFAPSATEGGNWMHDVTGQVADKLFPGIVHHYSTYTKDREYPKGDILIYADEAMWAKKLEALKCYYSQMTNVCRMYFETPYKNEYFV